MKVIDLGQRTSAWKEWRQEGISATSCAVILGHNPDKTCLELWNELVGLVTPPDLSVIPQVRKGQKYEPMALQAFEEKYGKIGLPICAESDEYPVIRASFDGLLEGGSPVEIKNLCESKHLEVLQLGVKSPAYLLYRWQVMHQMIVSGGEKGYLWFWSPKHEPKCLVVDRDEALIAEIIEAELAFWQLVETATAPAADPKRDLLPMDDGDRDKSWKPIAERRRELEKEISMLKAKMKELTTAAGELDSQLQAMMGDFLRADAYGVKITNYEVEGSIDWKAVAEKLGPEIPFELVAKHQSDTSMRTRVKVDVNFKEAPAPVAMPRIRKPVMVQSTEQAPLQAVGGFWF